MGVTPRQEIEAIASRFAIEGRLIGVEPFGGGHINDSYVLTLEQGDAARRYLLQRINDAVFAEPALVMENIQRVTAHLGEKLRASGASDADRRVLQLVPSTIGEPFIERDSGDYWRLYWFIESAVSHQSVSTPHHAYEAGRAFGEFQRLLADLAGARLNETIPDFHNTPMRIAALQRAVEADAYGRVKAARPEINFAKARDEIADALLNLSSFGDIPERTTHNDAKISNVLFDRISGEAVCVVDLDTVMPGLSLYDFGDMVRSMATTAAEDERDLSKVELRLELFEAVARGYLGETHAMLTPAEREHLVLAGKLITLEQGVRFLTDFLSGDTYYKTTRPNQNLDRCRTQFKLVEEMERKTGAMDKIVERAFVDT